MMSFCFLWFEYFKENNISIFLSAPQNCSHCCAKRDDEACNYLKLDLIKYLKMVQHHYFSRAPAGRSIAATNGPWLMGPVRLRLIPKKAARRQMVGWVGEEISLFNTRPALHAPHFRNEIICEGGFWEIG